MTVNVGSMVPWVQNNKELYTCKIDPNYCTFTLPKYFTIGNDKLYYLYVIYNHNSQSCDHIIAHSQRKGNFKWSCSGRLGNNSKLDSVLFHQCFMFEKTSELSATQTALSGAGSYLALEGKCFFISPQRLLHSSCDCHKKHMLERPG